MEEEMSASASDAFELYAPLADFPGGPSSSPPASFAALGTGKSTSRLSELSPSAADDHTSPTPRFWCCALCPERARQISPGQRPGCPGERRTERSFQTQGEPCKGGYNSGAQASEPLAGSSGTLVSPFQGSPGGGAGRDPRAMPWTPRAMPWALLWLPLSGRNAEQRSTKTRQRGVLRVWIVGMLLALSPVPSCFGQTASAASGLERVLASKHLRYGSDMEGGGPYAYPDPSSPRNVTGFEVELMSLLGAELGVTPVYSQGQWDKLLQLLGSGRIDIVVNGYEWSPLHGRDYLATRPYYVYQLQINGTPRRRDPHPGLISNSQSLVAAAGSSACWSARPPTIRHRRRRPKWGRGPLRRRHRRHDGRAEPPARRHPARPARRRCSIGRVPQANAGRPARFARLLRDLHPAAGSSRSATRSIKACARLKSGDCVGSTKNMGSGPKLSKSSRASLARSNRRQKKQPPVAGHSCTSTAHGCSTPRS